MASLCPLISEKALQARIRALGAQIRADYRSQELTCICVLRGALFFSADLVRSIGGDLRIEFIHLNSSMSPLQMEVNFFTGNIKDQNCILIEDIVETGSTLKKLKAYH